jgi:hypothetical protein
MFKGFDWQHWVLIVTGLVVTAGPDVATALGADALPGPAATVTRVVAFLSLLGALLKASPLDRPKPPGPPGFAARGFVRVPMMFVLAVIGSLGAAGLVVSMQAGCSAGVASAVVAAVPYIDGAVCTLAAAQTNEPGWETFVCSIIDPGGNPVKFSVRVPAAQAKAFGMAHRPR